MGSWPSINSHKDEKDVQLALKGYAYDCSVVRL